MVLLRSSAVLLLLLSAFVFAGSAITIEGMIEGTEDEEGSIVSVAIGVYNSDTDEYEYYQIAKKGKGAELHAKIGEVVKVTGTVETSQTGEKVLTVQSYEIAASSNEGEEDYEF